MLRYGFVGASAFIVDFGLMILLSELCHCPYLASASISFTAGLITNYALSVKWVFNSQKTNNGTKTAEFMLFALIGVIGLGLNAVIIWSLTELLIFHYTVSKLCSTIIVFFWNFIARRFLFSNISSKWNAKNQTS